MCDKFEDFIKRVYTYELGKWMYQSKKLNPYKFAQHGFICTKTNLV